MHNDGLVYSKIVDCLSACKQLISTSQWMRHTHSAIYDVETRMHEPMQLAIVGRISSSKSTLVNAILGKADVVRTGHEAETFNVSWLKYGDDNAPIVVHFKNGQTQSIERNQWAEWASHKGQQSLKTQVKYMEVTSHYEMLKYINIIDTPGLDATSKVDSENTIEFLKSVNPDAVILLFSKSLSEDTLKLISEFQQTENSIAFSINPMNALGILSKVDVNWDISSNNDPIKASEMAITRTLSSRSDVNKSLFKILPVSALIGLASSTISEFDMSIFQQIASLNDDILDEMFEGVQDFCDEYNTITISSNIRKQLVEKYSLYGVYICVKEIQNNTNITLTELSKILRKQSGFDTFFKLVTSHFGDRAQLIKAQRGMLSLLEAIRKDQVAVKNQEQTNLIKSIYSRILSIENDLHELKEWSLLLQIYEDRVKVDGEFMDEFLRIAGENGHSAINKLNVDAITDISVMEERALERYHYWKTKYNAWYGLSHTKAEPYSIIARSYELLALRLKSQRKAFEDAQRTIRIFKHYIYGEDTL